jgi:hypothetical protein
MKKWQPIETAPKDGTEILIRGHRGAVFIAKWHTDRFGASAFCEHMNDAPVVSPTHWMPLPDPPSLSQGREDQEKRT